MVADIDTTVPIFRRCLAARRAIAMCRLRYRTAVRASPTRPAGVCQLLSLPDSRFVPEDVLALLDVPVLAARFDIDEDALRYLRQWVNESGVRWGMDDDNVQEFELPVTGQHTWQFGLTRMLLGYAMESSQGGVECRSAV